MLGHTDIRTTQIYAKILDHKVAADMATLNKKFSGTKIGGRKKNNKGKSFLDTQEKIHQPKVVKLFG